MEYFYSIFCRGFFCVFIWKIGDAKRKRPINLTSFLYFRVEMNHVFVLFLLIFYGFLGARAFCFDEGTYTTNNGTKCPYKNLLLSLENTGNKTQQKNEGMKTCQSVQLSITI